MTGSDATIAIVGLGAIGRPMAERIAAAGLPLVVCDVRPEAVAGLPDSVGRAASPRGRRQSRRHRARLPAVDRVRIAAR